MIECDRYKDVLTVNTISEIKVAFLKKETRNLQLTINKSKKLNES